MPSRAALDQAENDRANQSAAPGKPDRSKGTAGRIQAELINFLGVYVAVFMSLSVEYGSEDIEFFILYAVIFGFVFLFMTAGIITAYKRRNEIDFQKYAKLPIIPSVKKWIAYVIVNVCELLLILGFGIAVFVRYKSNDTLNSYDIALAGIAVTILVFTQCLFSLYVRNTTSVWRCILDVLVAFCYFGIGLGTSLALAGVANGPVDYPTIIAGASWGIAEAIGAIVAVIDRKPTDGPSPPAWVWGGTVAKAISVIIGMITMTVYSLTYDSSGRDLGQGESIVIESLDAPFRLITTKGFEIDIKFKAVPSGFSPEHVKVEGAAVQEVSDGEDICEAESSSCTLEINQTTYDDVRVKIYNVIVSEIIDDEKPIAELLVRIPIYIFSISIGFTVFGIIIGMAVGYGNFRWKKKNPREALQDNNIPLGDMEGAGPAPDQVRSSDDIGSAVDDDDEMLLRRNINVDRHGRSRLRDSDSDNRDAVGEQSRRRHRSNRDNQDVENDDGDAGHGRRRHRRRSRSRRRHRKEVEMNAPADVIESRNAEEAQSRKRRSSSNHRRKRSGSRQRRSSSRRRSSSNRRERNPDD